MKLKFDPVMLFKTDFQYGNRIALEFNLLYHWHPLMPDTFTIDGDTVSYKQFVFNTSIVSHYGIEKLVSAFSRQPAGQVKKKKNFENENNLLRCSFYHTYGCVLQIGGGHNINAIVANVAVKTIEEARLLRVQPFNEYRKRFHLKPYSSFREFNGKKNNL